MRNREGWIKKVSNVKILYKSARGVMSFDKKKPIFQHKNSEVCLSVGLGVIVEGSFVDKGKFSFAEMENIESVLPPCYLTIDYFENVGVPQKIFKGIYGNSIFIKEEYLNKTFIKALDIDGNILIHETLQAKNNSFNIHFGRLDNAIGLWSDITEYVHNKILSSIESKNSDVNLNNPYILYALRRLHNNSLMKSSNGVILATGKYETLVVWGKDSSASMAWFCKRIETTDAMEDIKEDVKRKMVENGII
jgi:hypothetical protein